MKVYYEDLPGPCGIIRIGERGERGEPYDISLTVAWSSTTECELMGLDKKPSKAIWQAIARWATERGVFCSLRRLRSDGSEHVCQIK